MATSPKLSNWSRSKPKMVGEYNASAVRDSYARRWWNGEYWSVVYYPKSQSTVAQQARRRIKASENHHRIYWRGLIEKPKYPFPPGALE